MNDKIWYKNRMKANTLKERKCFFCNVVNGKIWIYEFNAFLNSHDTLFLCNDNKTFSKHTNSEKNMNYDNSWRHGTKTNFDDFLLRIWIILFSLSSSKKSSDKLLTAQKKHLIKMLFSVFNQFLGRHSKRRWPWKAKNFWTWCWIWNQKCRSRLCIWCK